MIEKIINGMRLAPEPDTEDIIEDEIETNGLFPGKKLIDFGKRSWNSESIVIAKPKHLEDSTSIIDSLMEGNIVTINLSDVKEQDRQRILDMIAGYCYSTDCNLQQVSPEIFIAAHKSIVAESCFK